MSLKLVSEKYPWKATATPQFFFEKVRDEYAFLLESGQLSQSSVKNVARNSAARSSYIGSDPFLVCTYQAGVLTLEWRRTFLARAKNMRKKLSPDAALEVLRKLFKQFHDDGKSPVPFGGGAVGYFGYDFGVRLAELSQHARDDLHLPDFRFLFVDKVIAIDHERREIFLLAFGKDSKIAKKNLLNLKAKVQIQAKDLKESKKIAAVHEITAPESTVNEFTGSLVLKKRWSQQQYFRKIAKIQQLIREGETYQVNFSQRFETDFQADPWDFYRKLLARNPVPFSCYFEFPDFQLVSISPELLLRKRGRQLESWPIKGTVRRGKNAIEDRRQIRQLLASTKDEAELAMITDLVRNDMGKISEFGSVKVLAEREIQRYRHVIHTVSKVSGMLRKGLDFFDAFKAFFPGGSITGCPKRRTMEIIDRLEGFQRGIYTGSAGFIGFNGESDLNILIRSSVIKNGKIFFQAGGGIVADSDPQQEYDEVLAKARGFLEEIVGQTSGAA